MTFEKWVKQNIGKGIDYDGTYGVQCVDLAKHYIKNVLGITPQSIGNAIEYYNKRKTSEYLTKNFKWIDNTAEFIPKKGDLCVFTSKSGHGHISVATGEGTTSYFYSYDQNFPKAKHEPMTKIKHSYNSLLGVLRPKKKFKRGKDTSSNTSHGLSFVKPVDWKNDSTIEKAFESCNLSGNIGSISSREEAKCYGKKSKGYIVVYKIDGSNKHKVGFVKYSGGVKSIPSGGKLYKNGSTIEKVYLDTAKKDLIGNLDKNESCMCLGIVDGMYLVLYKVNGSSNYKIGFVSYNGGIK